jgi:hypothetical protein
MRGEAVTSRFLFVEGNTLKGKKAHESYAHVAV